MSDLISRQAAIDAIRTKYCPSDFMDDGVIDAFAEIIQDLPSAQPEEDCDTCKHGHFGDAQCERCRVRYPSHYERRTDE